jgi:hypothetical protein
MIGLPEYNKYITGKDKGMNVKSIKHGIISTDIEYERKPPERNYYTFKEFNKLYFSI